MRRLTNVTLAVFILLSLVLVTSAGAAPENADRGPWAPNVWYNVGDTVIYNGVTYTAIQAHTSQVGWEPPYVPALWEPVSGPTNTPGPSVTPTLTLTPMQPAENNNIHQAETASFGGGVTIDSNNTGFLGTGYANFPLSGGFLQFNNVDGGAGGSATLRIRYALGATTSRTGLLIVNGTSQNLTFSPTGAWTTWSLRDVTVPLNAGTTNTIRFESNGQDLGNLDQIEIILIVEPTNTPTPTATSTFTPTSTATATATVTLTQPSGSNVYQAETASFGGGVTIDSNNAGFLGTGYANFPLSGGFVQFNSVDGGTGGSATLRIRYALGATTSRTGLLIVNGTSQNLTFSPTGAWTTWATQDVTVPLNAGTTNTLRFESNGQDLANLDQMEVELPVGAVCFYEDYSYGGASFCTNEGSANMPSGWNDRVSSVRVKSGYLVELFEDASQLGLKTTLTADIAKLEDRGFNDRASSYRIVKGSLPSFCANYPPATGSGTWQSSLLYYNASGRLQYTSDAKGNRIPDYSYAGYHYGERALPNVPVVTTLGPVSGDNTLRIQQALDAIGSRTPDANGFRGALLLLPGRYDVYGVLRIKQSGVVLRGSGDGTNTSTDTIIYARGDNPHQRTPLIIGTNDTAPWDKGSSTNVTDAFVPVGSMSFNVQNAGMFSVGQEVIITHPSSQAWIDALDGGGVTTGSWPAGSKDIPYIRKITRISGSLLTFDAPIYNHLDRSLTQATVSAVSGRNLIRESGIEDLRVDIETAGGEDENHAWSAIGVIGAEDSWVKNVSARYFGYAGVKTSGAIRITVQDASATDPVGIRTGGRFYNFDVDHYSQLILFTGCQAASGRHNFISNGAMSASGVVWNRCTTSGGNDSEGHRWWSTGLLFDYITGSGSRLKLINRGDWGTQHGWGAAHSTAWNSQAIFYIQKPPTAQNYGISGMGSVSTSYSWPGPSGYTDIRSSPLQPESLYEAQMCDRLEH